ncbi:precorrin-2 dehydrogenase/sirohydrochlorin ferrochelatase family protein [Fusibacter bizertensis]
MNNLLPVALNVSKLNILIVGLGNVGQRKFDKYQATGANLTTVDPKVKTADYLLDFATYYKKFGIHFMKQHLVIICTDDPMVNHYITQVCERFAKLYNRTDLGDASLFTDMAIYEDENSLVAVTSKSQSPYIAKHLLTCMKPQLESTPIKEEIKWLMEQTSEAKENHETYDELMMRWRELHDR